MFKSLIELVIGMAAERNLRVVIDYTPVEDFVFHFMTHFHKLFMQMLSRNSHSNAGNGTMIGQISLGHVFILFVVQMSQR